MYSMKKIIVLVSMGFILVSCGWEKQYDYSWVSTTQDGQQEIKPAKIEVIEIQEAEIIDETGE